MIPRWAVRAQADLARAETYYQPLDSAFAARIIQTATAAGDLLCEHPQLGRATRRRGVRKWRVKGTPFILLYRIAPGEIRIIRVAHDRQDWDRW